MEIKVGLDCEDAVRHGFTLLMPLRALSSPRHKKGLRQAGFDLQLADKMLAEKAWHSLHNDGQIEHPSRGVSIDVSTAWKMYQCVKFGTLDPYDPYDYMKRNGWERHLEMKMLEDKPERSLSKNENQLVEWCERQGQEPDPEALEDA